jgi:transcription antitermination factor NusG
MSLPPVDPPAGPRWYALYTKARHEKKVDLQLREKKIESYLPMRRTLKQWSDRKKWIEEPLFRSYVFVRGEAAERYRAVQCVGVVRLVTFKGQLAVVRDEEIDMIRRILAEIRDPESCPVEFAVGDLVEISTGPLAGIRGRLEEVRGEKRFVVSVASISQGIRFAVEGWNLKKIGGTNPRP